VSFRHPRLTSAELVSRLAQAGIVTADRAGAVRVSPHFYNDPEDIEALLNVVAESG